MTSKFRSIAAAIVLSSLAQPSVAFWRLQCFGVVARGQIDPIVSPGEMSSHEHAVKGPNTFGASATVESLLASTCTSCEVRQDHSAYWEPQLYFFDEDGTVSPVIETPGHLTYYKHTPCFTSSGALVQPEAMPNGLRMISGDPFRRNFSLPVPDPPQPWRGADATQEALAQKAIGFNCLNYASAPEASLYRHTLPDKAYLDAYCRDGLRVELLFPYCWNGQLDSPDHKSHLAFPDAGANGGRCPAGYDRVLTQLFFETIYPVHEYAHRQGFFAFSTGDPTGCGMHGDVLVAWEGDSLARATALCGPLNGPGVNGVASNCSVFEMVDPGAQAACTVPQAYYPPGATARVNAAALALNALPGDNPLQWGPEAATKPAPQRPVALGAGFLQAHGTAAASHAERSGVSNSTKAATTTPPALQPSGSGVGEDVAATTVTTVRNGAQYNIVILPSFVTVTEEVAAPKQPESTARSMAHAERHAKRHAHRPRGSLL